MAAPPLRVVANKDLGRIGKTHRGLDALRQVIGMDHNRLPRQTIKMGDNGNAVLDQMSAAWSAVAGIDAYVVTKPLQHPRGFNGDYFRAGAARERNVTVEYLHALDRLISWPMAARDRRR